MPKFRLQQAGQWLIPLATFVLLVSAIIGLASSSRRRTLTVAAGASTGDSYLICQALKQTVEEIYPNLRVKVVETKGSVENVKMLETGTADLATVQADVDVGPEERSVAVLFDDVFQLLAHARSGIRGFPELRGKRIGLSRGGGQFDSFLRVADHFGLRESDFQFVGENDGNSDQAFAQGKADALFRVRALGNPSIQRLASLDDVSFLPIEQAAAMRITHTAFDPSAIPAGAYRGNPPTPPENLPTIAIHRFLLARAGADETAIRSLTSVLIDRRPAIMAHIPDNQAAVRLLLAQTRRPDSGTDLGPGVHPGAAAFFDKDKPSFVQAHADFVGLLITLAIMMGSWVWQVKGWIERKQKNKADEYSNRVVALMGEAEQAQSIEWLAAVRQELLAILTSAVRDLDADRLSEESFQSFYDVLQIALEVARERRDLLPSKASERSSAAVATSQ